MKVTVPTWPHHASPSGFPPGNLAYCKDGCRCAGCKAGAQAVYKRRRVDPEGHQRTGVRPRGRACFQTGCDHPECRQANRDYQRNWYRMNRSSGWVDLFEDITDVG